MSSQITAEEFVAALHAHGVRNLTGVPCGHLAGPWALFDRAAELTPATSEGAALAIAAGWELGSRRSAVFCQNSGFGNLLNPLASLLLPYRIPVLVIMTMRGWPDQEEDEQQHAVMGTSTTGLLEALGVPYAFLAPDKLSEALLRADEARARRQPYFLLVPRGSIGKAAGAPPAAASAAEGRLSRARLVSALMAELTDELLITTTGYLSRQAHHERDRPGTFYMQGSMGHALAIGTGLAIAHPDRRTVVLDGDGAFLMHLGTGSTVGASGARNLVHIVADNGCYESTGCQRSTSGSLDWPSLGHGLGYRSVLTCHSASLLAQSLRTALSVEGPVLLALTVVPTPGDVYPRATASHSLPQIAERFQEAATDWTAATEPGASTTLSEGGGSP
jgi:phosphonopyruvate decarboxylase